MDVNIISEFLSGRSKSKVYLAELNGIIGVYKTNIRDTAGIVELSSRMPFRTPEIYEVDETSIFMEYIKGSSMKDTLRDADSRTIGIVSKFILSYIDFSMSSSSGMFDFSTEINDKISQVSKYVPSGLFSDIRTFHPKTVIHGDLTFDNLIYTDGNISMIDLSPTVFSSINFDINKFRQDISGMWFVRNEVDNSPWINSCNKIYNDIQYAYPTLLDDTLYHLMISRIIPYCDNHVDDRNYVLSMLGL